MEDLSAVGQLEPNLDLIIAIQVHKKHVDIGEDPQCPTNWQHVVRLGAVGRAQVPLGKGPSRSSGDQTSLETT